MSGKREDAVANLDAVTATGSGSWVNSSAAEDVLCVLDASAVTTGGTAKLEANTKSDGSGITYTVVTVNVTATGATSVAIDRGDVPAAVRWNLSARTDGTYTGTVALRRS